MGKGHGAAPSAPRKYVVDMSATEVASELEALSFGDLAKAVAAKGLGGPALVEHHAAGTLAGELGVEAIPGELASRLLGAAPCGGGKTITILHFNDVYNLEPGKKEPVGGAAKFASLVAAEKAKCAEAGLAPPIVTFAGDALNPSMCSTFFKGRQMVPILNGLDVKVATVGNHDLDFGVENLQWVMKESSFPWLLANIRDAASGKILAGAAETHVVDHDGARVGFVGLAEEEWITTLATVNEDQVRYEDFVACGVRLAKELRAAGCDLVLALTHMRVPNEELWQRARRVCLWLIEPRAARLVVRRIASRFSTGAPRDPGHVPLGLGVRRGGPGARAGALRARVARGPGGGRGQVVGDAVPAPGPDL